MSFEVFHHGIKLTDVSLILTGRHNIYNTLAVITALNESGVNINNIKSSFSTFTGMGRRFQHICDINNIKIYDDYAHHPTEIKAVLDSASTKFGKENIIAVFQPHRYTRLKGLWDEFKNSFFNAQRVIVTDVFEASEEPIENITGENFAIAGNFEHISGSIQDVAQKLLPSLKEGSIVIGLGAGTITNLGKYIKEYSIANRM